MTRKMTRILAITLLGVAFALPAPHPAMALSAKPDCSSMLQDLDKAVKEDNHCDKDSDCMAIAQPPCGCEYLSLNPENAETASITSKTCTTEGLVCEACKLPEYAITPHTACIDHSCGLRK